MGNGTTILFGLPGVAVRDAKLSEGGERTVHVVTADPTAAACPICGGSRPRSGSTGPPGPKDLPYGDTPLCVRWRKAQYRCREARCPRKAFTESIAELPPGTRVTGRLRRHAGGAVGAGSSVAGVAARLPVSWPTVHEGFVAHAESVLTEPTAPIVPGIDETRRGRPRWTRTEAGGWERLERFETNFVDLAGDGGLLGQTAGRTGAAVVSWLDARGETWKSLVQVVVMDPRAGYHAAVAEALPNARVVVDHFHLVRLTNLMVTDVRQRVAREQLGRRGRKVDPAWAHRRLLLRAGDRLPPRARSRMVEVLERDDPTNEIGAAWGVKELLRQLLAATDRSTISARLHRFHEAVLRADMPETTRLAVTVDDWWPQILGFLQTRITNAGTEGTNRLIKDAARLAFGFRNLDNQRRRVRFHCTRRSHRIVRAEAAPAPQLR